MVTVYFLRHGSGKNSVCSDLSLTLSEIVDAFPQKEFIFSEIFPTINSENAANPVAKTTEVVLHVEGGDVAGKIKKDGFWMFKSVSPEEFHDKFK